MIKFLIRNLRRVVSLIEQDLWSLHFRALQFYFLRKSTFVKVKGRVRLFVGRDSILDLGEGIRINSDFKSNPIGGSTFTNLYVDNGAKLTIGSNVGLSNTTVFCKCSISIGERTLIGGNVVIYDTDFHSVNYIYRRENSLDTANISSSPVEIGSDVFIGAHSLILKGVEIGDFSIIGAGSVVTKKVPSGEIWAGNPARFVKKIAE